MLKRLLFVLVVMVFALTAQAGSKFVNDSNWFVKGGVGFDATKPDLEKGDLHFSGDFQVLRMVKGERIALQGGYVVLQDPEPDIDYYKGTIVFFTRSVKDQSKWNPYVMAGGGLAHDTEKNNVAFDVGIGVLIPFFGATPNFELKIFDNGEFSKLVMTLGFQMGLDLNP